MLKPPHFLSPGERGMAVEGSASGIAQVKQDIKKMQSNARYQDGSHRHQCDGLPLAGPDAAAARPNESPLVLAKQLLDPSQGDRIHIPGISREIPNVLDGAVSGSVKPVVHAGGQAQGREIAVLPVLHVLIRSKQIFERVGEALGLKDLGSPNRAVRPDDGIDRACQHQRIDVNRSGTVLELACEAVVHAAKCGLLGLAQIKLREESPDTDGQVAQPRRFNLAKAPHPLGEPAPGQAIRQQKVDVFLVQEILNGLTQARVTGWCFGLQLEGTRCD